MFPIFKLGAASAIQNVWFGFLAIFQGLYFFKNIVPTHAGARAASPGGTLPGARKEKIVLPNINFVVFSKPAAVHYFMLQWSCKTFTGYETYEDLIQLISSL